MPALTMEVPTLDGGSVTATLPALTTELLRELLEAANGSA
jgi:hypothetical protein